MKTVSKIFIMMLAGLSMMMVSCKKENPNSSTVKFNLTDAPGAYEAVYVDIKGVEVNTEADGWVMLESDLGKVNLLDYMNGKTTLLAEGNIAAGKVNQVRLILGSDNSIVVDGQTFQLQTPSAMQSGLKLNLSNKLEAGGTYEWTIDFDAAQSIVATGSGSFILKPTLRIIVDELSAASAKIDGGGSVNIDGGGSNIDIETGTSVTTGGGSSSTQGSVVVETSSGNITGKVNVTGGLAIVYATNASGISTSTMTAIDGTFKLQSLASGSYNIKVEPMVPIFSSKTLSNISVQAQQTTDIGLVTL